MPRSSSKQHANYSRIGLSFLLRVRLSVQTRSRSPHARTWGRCCVVVRVRCRSRVAAPGRHAMDGEGEGEVSGKSIPFHDVFEQASFVIQIYPVPFLPSIFPFASHCHSFWWSLLLFNPLTIPTFLILILLLHVRCSTDLVSPQNTTLVQATSTTTDISPTQLRSSHLISRVV